MASIKPPRDLSKDDISRIPVTRVNKGHTKAMQIKLRAYRLEMLHGLLSQGHTLRAAARIMGYSEASASLDLAKLREQFRQRLASYITQELPELFQQCITQLNRVMVAVDEISHDKSIDLHERLHAHNLMLSLIESKAQLLSDPTIINEAVQIVDQTKRQLIELSPEKSKMLLRAEEQQEQELEEEQALAEEEEKIINNHINYNVLGDDESTKKEDVPSSDYNESSNNINSNTGSSNSTKKLKDSARSHISNATANVDDNDDRYDENKDVSLTAAHNISSSSYNSNSKIADPRYSSSSHPANNLDENNAAKDDDTINKVF